MESATQNLNQHLGRRVHELRVARGLSLAALASRSGVSRSMLSVIERGESSPTAVVLEKIAAALGVILASLFETGDGKASPSRPVVRRKDQAQWKDPGSGYVRRNISPPGARQPIQMVEVCFPAGGRVAFDSGARDARVHQQVWVLEGAINITAGSKRHQLSMGDCLAMELDGPTMFHNPTRKAARYVVVTATEPSSRL